MSKQTTLHCPACELQMTVIPLDEAYQVVCPECFQRMLLFPGRPPLQPKDVEEFKNLPEPVIVSTQVATKPATSERFIRKVNRRAFRRNNRELIRSIRKRRIALVLVVLVCLTAVSMLGAGAYSIYQRTPSDQWASMVPGMDTPAKVVREYNSLSNALVKTFNGIHDEKSRDASIGRIRMLTGRLDELPPRVAEMGRLSDYQRDELAEDFIEECRDQVTRVEDATKRVMGKRMIITSGLITDINSAIATADKACVAICDQWE